MTRKQMNEAIKILEQSNPLGSDGNYYVQVHPKNLAEVFRQAWGERIANRWSKDENRAPSNVRNIR